MQFLHHSLPVTPEREDGPSPTCAGSAMPALALPPTSAYPSDPTALERDRLDALYLELRGNYKSLMISRGIHRSRAQRQGEQLRELSTRLRALATREASVKAEAFAMLEIIADVVEHLEDAGDEVSNAFGEYQLGRRAYSGGGGITRLIQAVIRFLNRWRLGKQRFEELSARQQTLRRALESSAEQPAADPVAVDHPAQQQAVQEKVDQKKVDQVQVDQVKTDGQDR
jgi:hypothetical protein